MRKLILAIIVIAPLLNGCATVHESYAPDGRKAYALNCSGLARGWDKCQIAAGEICGAAGYDIIDRISEGASVAYAAVNENGGVAQSSKPNERSMLISCKLPK